MAPRIHPSNDCGNSPKNLFAQRAAIALCINDLVAIRSFATDDFVWHLPDGTTVRGNDGFNAPLSDVLIKATDINILQVITHGAGGSVSGLATLKDKSQCRFCHTISFNGAKASLIREVVTFLLFTKTH